VAGGHYGAAITSGPQIAAIAESSDHVTLAGSLDFHKAPNVQERNVTVGVGIGSYPCRFMSRFSQ
jgi:hypothetical protein